MGEHDQGLLITTEQASSALAELGHASVCERGDGIPTDAYLLGALLAAVEAACQDLRLSRLRDVGTGYLAMLLELAGHDGQAAARWWAVMLNDRLNRTALELPEALAVHDRMFVEVAGPAMLVAANLLNVINHADRTPELLDRTITTASNNLEAARSNFDLLRDALRRQDRARERTP